MAQPHPSVPQQERRDPDKEQLKDELEKATDMITATSKLDMRTPEIRNARPNWKSYLQGGMVTQEDYNFVTEFEATKGNDRKLFLEKHKAQCAKTFINLMTNVSKEQTVRYILTLIDDMFNEDRTRVDIFFSFAKKQKQSVWAPFLSMLNRQDPFIVNKVSRIITKLACWSAELMDGSDLLFYLNWLKDQLRLPNNEYINTPARDLQMLLRIDEYRHAFLSTDGISTLLSALAGKANFQLQYQLIFCIWCLTFNGNVAERLHRYPIIPTLADILTETTKEKVQRIIVASFRNFIEKVEDREIVRESAVQMVSCKVMKTLELLQDKKLDDQEFVDDIQFLVEQLQASVQDLSSFDEYSTEVKSGRLQWSPVHKSEKFWRENVQHFNEKNFEIVKILIRTLELATDPLILCVATHDIGEYVRHYPRGKAVIEQLNGKQLVMRLLTHEDPNVRYQALLAVQKIMVHNWEYLGKQLEKETTGGGEAKPKQPVPGKA